jgi:hypothetical protein
MWMGLAYSPGCHHAGTPANRSVLHIGSDTQAEELTPESAEDEVQNQRQ